MERCRCSIAVEDGLPNMLIDDANPWPSAAGASAAEALGVAMAIDPVTGQVLPKILVVEDDADLLLMMKTMLKTVGEITLAKDGQEATTCSSRASSRT